MSVEKVEMFTVVCDNCKKDIGSESEYSCWNDSQYSEECATESGWHKEDDKHYCVECHLIDEDDNLIIHEEYKDVNQLK